MNTLPPVMSITSGKPSHMQLVHDIVRILLQEPVRTMWPAPNTLTKDSGPAFFERPTIVPSSAQSISTALCQSFLRLQFRALNQAAIITCHQMHLLQCVIEQQMLARHWQCTPSNNASPALPRQLQIQSSATPASTFNTLMRRAMKVAFASSMKVSRSAARRIQAYA